MTSDSNTESATNGKCCGRCGESFTCGLAAGEEPCWCADLPHVMPVDGAVGDCLCPHCLRGEIDARLAAESSHERSNASAGLDFSPSGEETE
ncbi:MAG: cysteine-rich CWC family protein [Planctomycetaceae bacterium]|nr:cysteine-rich CWC family protein [Planctomycetaceae bacterium]MBT6155221.1 cysteine-rich CWC family protein [Planctomycetaceae bacterium]MBT6483263.1 cysteine-rich CWC family protein [Planctomycetaceae bacterium]MBT6494590.1 cysteine-rich CWC family protein [Planctomycetaceae bacterium]